MSRGDVYSGFFKDDVPEGEGTYWYANGSVYQG